MKHELRPSCRARIRSLAVPLVEPEPVVLAGHGVPVVVDLLPTEVCGGSEDPQVHHDLGRLVGDRWLTSMVLAHHLATV